MREVKLHQKVSFIPFTMLDKDGGTKFEWGVPSAVRGEVTYINQAHSWFLVSYDVGGYILRETFQFHQIGEDVTLVGRC